MKDTIKSKKLEGFDINIKPYIPIEEQNKICTLVMESDNYFEREIKLVLSVFCAVVDDADDKLDLTYDDIVTSGIWDALYEEVGDCIDNIKDAIKYYSSMEYIVNKGLNMLTEKLDNINESFPTLEKVIELMQTEGLTKVDVPND